MYKLVLSIIVLVFLISEICFSMAPDQVYEKVKDSVVVIKAYSNTGQLVGLGSGVILPSGSIVTNYHVIKMGSRYTVGQNNKTTQATVRAADSNKPGLCGKNWCKSS